MALFKKNISDNSSESEVKNHAILIVDDEVANLKTLKRLLEDDYYIYLAESGVEALTMLGDKTISDKIHLIISDQRMPNMTGVEFLSKSIELMPLAVRIILTGYTDVNEIIDSINIASIYKFITKPIEPEEFKLTVKRAIESYDIETENYSLVRELQELNQNLEQKVKERTQELETANRRLEEMSVTDELTQLHNRRYMNHKLDEEVARSKRYSNNLSIALFDIDHFKSINDTHGHPKGDAVLVDVSKRIKNCERKTDYSARFGGEEFLILFPETDTDEAVVVCERIRKEIEASLLKSQGIPVTISAGVTSFIQDEDADELVDRVDKLLYRAKEEGRNRVVSE